MLLLRKLVSPALETLATVTTIAACALISVWLLVECVCQRAMRGFTLGNRKTLAHYKTVNPALTTFDTNTTTVHSHSHRRSS